MPQYLARAVDPAVARLLGELPAILLVGPRATGKTTTAARHARSVIRLDRPGEAAAFRADPDAALAGLPEPILLDEWQAVPEVLGAVKRAVDADRRPGRFLLTGSVRADLEAETWPGTGRVVRIAMWPLTVAEQLGVATKPFIDRVADGVALEPASSRLDLRGYIDVAFRSGFPEAQALRTASTRTRWLESYVDQLLTRDAATIEPRRDPARLRKYFEAYALSTAGIVQDRTLFEAAGVNRKTAVAYEHLLANLLVVEALPAWSTNRLKRLVQAPKRHVVDVGFLAGALGLDGTSALSDGDLLGRVLESFVVSQLRAEAAVSTTRARLHHLRAEQGRHEIDVLFELGAGRVVAVEVKAASAPDRSSADHLSWLRDELGKRFVAGIVLHTGPRTFSLGDRLIAAPISTLWAGKARRV